MANQFPVPEPVALKKINDRIYLATGGIGANTGFFLTDKSVIAIDAKMDKASSEKSIKEIRKISNNPITHMLITHGDIDHVNGLDAFPENMTIIAHPAAKNDMAKSFEEQSMNYLNAYLPNRTFKDILELNIDEETIKLIYVSPAHTSGDILVFFPKYRILFAGDLVFTQADPLVHLHKGGSTFGLVKYLNTILDLDAEIILGGHIESADKNQIRKIIDNISEKQAGIKDLISEGKNLEEIKTIYNVQDIIVRPGAPKFPSLVENIFNEIVQKAD